MTSPRAEYMRQYGAANKDRIAAYHKDYQKKHRKRNRLKTYGLTVDQYDTMVAAQHGACAICGKVPTYDLIVDHDHETGRVRGLICQGCNAGIGYLGDTVAALQRALDYLRHG